MKKPLELLIDQILPKRINLNTVAEFFRVSVEEIFSEGKNIPGVEFSPIKNQEGGQPKESTFPRLWKN